MKNMRSLVIGVVAIALVCGVAWVLRPKRQPAPQDPPRPAVAHRVATSLRPKSISHLTEPRMARAPVQPQPSGQESSAPAPGRRRPKPAEAQIEADQAVLETAQADGVTPQGTSDTQETIQDSMTQAALAYIGVDPDEEMYWDGATDDPGLSAQDMVEDSNEDDLSDTEESTTDDLP